MDLIIVESPTKAKTITKFLDSNYKVESSFGHIRDLPKSKMGIDIKNNFEPEYVVPDAAQKTVTNLKKLAKKADNVILAPDEDREGEAIAWHLAETLGIDPKKTQRIVFHEITKGAILEALKTPKTIDQKMVDAQQARRMLDRLVGYELSPFLWKKVARGLSAGRVQSVAIRLIVEREEEINKFKVDEYWGIKANLQKENNDFSVLLNKKSGKTITKLHIKNKEEADKIIGEIEGSKFVISKIEKKQTEKNPPKPFTTSTLQQIANRWFGFSAKQTMMNAQQLYEIGLITYMRTDSLNLSKTFLNDAQKYLNENLGKEYALTSPRQFKTKSKGAQEAHEAIRPVEVSKTPDMMKAKLNSNQHKLYQLIWQRSLAGQSSQAIVDSTTVDIDASDTKYQFRTSGQILRFPGYLKIYPEQSKDIELPELNEQDELELIKLEGEQHFTKPPARYSDAGLVKIMEKYGIGRPSTYAPTISTIIARNYVSRDDSKRLAPTDIAFVVNRLLMNHFSDIVDFEFTAELEDDLDRIASGKVKWQDVIKNFYRPFHKNLLDKEKNVTRDEIMPAEKSDEKCDKCGAEMIIKTGRYGKYLACSGYPDCKNIKSIPGSGKTTKEEDAATEKLQKKYEGEKCDKCDGDMVIKNGRFGPFLGCDNYPKCKSIKSIKENSNSTGIKCPKCGKGDIVQKRSKRGVFYACDKYPDCKNAYWAKPTGDKCPDCKSLLVTGKEDSIVCSQKGCGYTK